MAHHGTHQDLKDLQEVLQANAEFIQKAKAQQLEIAELVNQVKELSKTPARPSFKLSVVSGNVTVAVESVTGAHFNAVQREQDNDDDDQMAVIKDKQTDDDDESDDDEQPVVLEDHDGQPTSQPPTYSEHCNREACTGYPYVHNNQVEV